MLKDISKMRLGIKIGRMRIDIIGYADDIPLVSNILINLQKMLEAVENYCNQHEIKVNGDKTVLLIFNKWCQRSKKELTEDSVQFKPKLQGYELKENYTLKYLGVEIVSDLTNTRHLDAKCNKAIKAMASIKAKGLCDKQIHAETKSVMYNSFIMPILTYCVELLVLNKKEMNQIRITESNMIKTMLNVRSSCRSKPILNAMRVEHLSRRINKMKLSLFIRLNENEYTKTLLNECEINKIELDFMEQIKEDTHELSDAHSVINKCKIKIDILKKASNDEWKSCLLALKLREIFNMPLRSKISSLITQLTSTYTPNFLLT